MNLAEYTMRLLLRYKQLELTKIEYPAFNVIDIWAFGETIYALVDTIEPLKEVAEEDEYGDYVYMGIHYTKYKEIESEDE